MDTGLTEMASPQQVLDDLVELFHADRIDALVRHIFPVSLLKRLAPIDVPKREGLDSIFLRRHSDLLAGFAVDYDLFPGNPAGRHKIAFNESVEWIRCLLRSINKQRTCPEPCVHACTRQTGTWKKLARLVAAFQMLVTGFDTAHKLAGRFGSALAARTRSYLA
jgi:hypothetical protein